MRTTIRDTTEGAFRLACSTCGKSVSAPLRPVLPEPPDGGLLVRAVIFCPECIEHRAHAAVEALLGGIPEGD